MNRSRETQAIQYINTKLNPILSKLTIDIINNQPSDIIDYMINWLLSNASIKTNIIKIPRWAPN